MAYAALGMYLVRFFLRSFCSLAACCFAILTLSCANHTGFSISPSAYHVHAVNCLINVVMLVSGTQQTSPLFLICSEFCSVGSSAVCVHPMLKVSFGLPECSIA